MKRLLSLILALSMVITLIPAVFAADETYAYEFYNGSWLERGNPVENKRVFQGVNSSYYRGFKTESLDDLEWGFIGSSVKSSDGISTSAASGNKAYNMVVGNFNTYATRAIAKNAGEWIAFKIEVPKNGTYTVDVKSYLYTSATTDLDVFLLPGNAEVSVGGYEGELLGAFDDQRVYGTFSEVTASDSTKYACERSGAKSFDEFSFSDIDANDYKVIDSANTYKKQGTGSAKTEGIQSISDTSEEIYIASGAYVLLLRANVGGEINVGSFSLTPVSADETQAPVELTGNITFGAGADFQYKVNEGNYTDINVNNVASIPAGSSVTVKISDTTNFAGWVRGTADSGVWVSSDAEYTFNIMSPTYLTPIYTTPEEGSTHVVEFWDENGAYVETITATDGKATLPTSGYGLVGGEFNGWWLNATTQLFEGDDVAEGITRAVAKYNYGTFGAKIENKNNSATYWKRGESIVAYGSSYDFYKWDGEETITYGTETVENKPVVVLDATPVDGAYMIEYDKGNATEVVEAGIIFGSKADIHIGSTDGSKAASQRNEDHGQFCAKPNENGNSDYVKGYLIYKGADSKLYVIYTAAIETSV